MGGVVKDDFHGVSDCHSRTFGRASVLRLSLIIPWQPVKSYVRLILLLESSGTEALLKFGCLPLVHMKLDRNTCR